MKTINLNHHIYPADFFRQSQPSEWVNQPEFIKDIFCFLRQWFDDSDSVEVQTSGSTGTPKIIRLSKEVMRQSARATLRFFDLKKADTALLCLSANYIAGKMMLVRAIEGELDLIAIAPASIVTLPTNLSLRFCAMVPMQVEETLKTSGKGLFSQIDSLIIGGASVSEILEHQLKELPTNCYMTYGMTETASHVALKRLNTTEPYKALPGISFAQDNRGCLVIDAPLLTQGSLITNDLVELVGNSAFYWKGRYDFVVNSGGIKLIPEILEKKIAPVFKQSFYLTKRKSTVYGEELILVLEGGKLDSQTEQSLLTSLGSVLAKYEIPKAIYYQSVFEYTSTGKLKRMVF